MNIIHIISLISAAIFGVLIGNYATTLLFRIPRKIEICGIDKHINTPPHCSICKHPLKFYEFLPVLSWIFARFKCNYCNSKVNPQYFILECSTALVSCTLYIMFNFSDKYILLMMLWSLILLAGLIHINHNLIVKDIVYAILTIEMIYQTLVHHSIITFLFNSLYIITIMLLSVKLNKSQSYQQDTVYLILQSSIFGIITTLIVLIIHNILMIKYSKYSYLYSNIILYCIIIIIAFFN